MLTLALAATLIGFVLLILGLITGTVWLAVACIVVCLVGLGFLLVDVFSSRRGETGRSIEDMVPGAGRDPHPSGSDRDQASSPGEFEAGGVATADESTRRYPTTPGVDTPSAGDDAPSGRAQYETPPFEPGMAAPERPEPSGRPAPERREGTLEDYLRSVGGDPSGDMTVVDPAARRDGPTQRFEPSRPGPGAPDPRPVPPRAAPPQPGRPTPPPRQQWASEGGRSDLGRPGPVRPEQGQPPHFGDRPHESRPFESGAPRWASGEQRNDDPAGPVDRSAPETRGDAPSRRPRDAGFDPLDPNWHPPPE